MSDAGRFTDAQLDAVRARHSVATIAGQYVTLRHKRAGEYVGPCPVCSANSESRSAGRFDCDFDRWKCAVCHDGGDVIRLVQMREGIGFREAVERLGGTREEAMTPVLAFAAGRRAFREGLPIEPPASCDSEDLRAAFTEGWRKAKAAAEYAAFARERERKRLFKFWKEASAIEGTPVARYLAARGLLVPPHARLKCHPAMPYFADGRENEPLLVHTGPAMLAAIRDIDGKFCGLHTTWLDPAGPKGKAALTHPESGDALPAKKVRGTKAGGFIDLGGLPVAGGRLFAGEGVETVLAVYSSLRVAGTLRESDYFRSSVDLGNLGGRATETVEHPTLKGPTGRAQRVPGPDPDLSSPAMPVPPNAGALVLLGDGDSDPLLTGNALERAAKRNAREGLAVRIKMAPPGLDFNDVILRALARTTMQEAAQ